MMTSIEEMRHSTAHILAAAVLKLWPKTKLGIGPVIEEGFYYDFDSDHTFTPEDFLKIEKEMKELISKNLKFEKQLISATEAKKQFKGDTYKLDLINEFEKEGKQLSFYKTGDFIDLCKGPHIDSTKEIKSFKLMKVASAYWRGDSNNKQLQRIYGTAFPTQKELDDYLHLLEEAKKRDHRKLGRELDLFTFSELVGPGLPLFTPKGALIRRLLNEYVEAEQSKAGYTQVWTPQIVKSDLFKISGHYDKYKDSMFKVKSNYSEEEFFLKPMNCPQHTQIYASQPRSYRDLPIRLTDFAMLYRDEKPGELSGLARVRSFSQDDCHVFCMESQVDEEIDQALSMTKQILATFGLKYKYRLSTRDPKHQEKYIGDPKTWDKAEKWAEKIMKRNKIEYFEGPGEAAFYAPKMDLIATDSLGREWQLSTLQIDYFLPERFNLTYMDSDGKEKRPVMLHRAILGSSERFMMVLIEHLAGKFPVWLSPVQVVLMTIADRHAAYAKKLEKELKENNIRIELDNRAESISRKVRDHQSQYIPYIITLGDREIETENLAIRTRDNKVINLKKKDLIEKILKEIKDKDAN